MEVYRAKDFAVGQISSIDAKVDYEPIGTELIEHINREIDDVWWEFDEFNWWVY